MKTEFEIASGILNYITSQEGVTDFPVTLKQVGDEVDTLRVRLLEELDSKGVLKSPFLNWTQVLTISKTSIDTSTKVRYIQVPRLFAIPSTQRLAIPYIGGAASIKTKGFRVVSGNQREWFKHDRWIGKLPTAVVIEDPNNEGYKIEFHNVSPNQVTMSAIFEDPSDLEKYGYNGDETIAGGGSLYPMPSGQVDVIIGKMTNSYMQTLYRHPLQANQTVDAPTQTKESN